MIQINAGKQQIKTAKAQITSGKKQLKAAQTKIVNAERTLNQKSSQLKTAKQTIESNEAKLVREGKITQQERENRILLRQVMKSAGFRALPSEWWHFNLCSRDEAKQKYKLIN